MRFILFAYNGNAWNVNLFVGQFRRRCLDLILVSFIFILQNSYLLITRHIVWYLLMTSSEWLNVYRHKKMVNLTGLTTFALIGTNMMCVCLHSMENRIYGMILQTRFISLNSSRDGVGRRLLRNDTPSNRSCAMNHY